MRLGLSPQETGSPTVTDTLNGFTVCGTLTITDFGPPSGACQYGWTFDRMMSPIAMDTPWENSVGVFETMTGFPVGGAVTELFVVAFLTTEDPSGVPQYASIDDKTGSKSLMESISSPFFTHCGACDDALRGGLTLKFSAPAAGTFTFSFDHVDYNTGAAPEPGSIALAAGGLLLIICAARVGKAGTGFEIPPS